MYLLPPLVIYGPEFLGLLGREVKFLGEECYLLAQDFFPCGVFFYLCSRCLFIMFPVQLGVSGLVFGIGWGAMKITGTYTEDVPGNEHVVLGDVQGETEEEDIYSILDITIEDILTAENAELDIPANPTVLDDETIEQYLIDTRVSSTAIALLE